MIMVMTLLVQFYIRKIVAGNFRCIVIKVCPPIEFLKLGVANPLITQMLLSDDFSMNTKFVDLTELYKLGSHKKIVTQKHFGDQGVCHTKIEKFYRRTHFNLIENFKY